MATVDLTVETFSSTIKDNPIVFVDLWATWCGPCRMFGPVFKAASEKHDDIVFGKVDTDAQQQLAESFQVTSIPTLMAFRDGQLVFRQAGALNSKQLEHLIEQVKDLDMSKLTSKAAQPQA